MTLQKSLRRAEFRQYFVVAHVVPGAAAAAGLIGLRGRADKRLEAGTSPAYKAPRLSLFAFESIPHFCRGSKGFK